jgi:ABC-type multidrug transport system ATPase subunit
MPVSETILEVRALMKSYAAVTAVNGVSFSVTAGTCFGLLGPNGAGKTTTIEIMEGILSATTGASPSAIARARIPASCFRKRRCRTF